MSDLNTEIKIGADASGVEAGVGKAKRSLKDLGDAAQKAGKDAGAGIGSIGAGGDKAAKDVERATKNMQGSLQRLLAEQKAGAKGSREYYEALADTRGISRNAIKPILDQIDAAKSKTLQAKTAADSWTASLGKVGPLVAAAFSGAAITGFLGKVVSVQREFDVLNSSLKTVTGSSAAAEREMAWLKDFAKETPFGLAQATQGFVKMKALGLDPTRAALTSFGNTASAMGKDLNQMIEAVADASTGEFERLKEFGIKAKKEGDNVSLTFQGVTTTIRNSAADITKYLEDIGNTSFGGAMEERAKTLDGTIAALGDTWDELFRTVSTNNVGGLIFDSVTLANGALEDATTILRALGGAAQDAGRDTGALSTIQSGLATAFETVAVLGANVAYVLKQTGNEIGGLVAQIAQFAKSGGGAFMLFDVITKGRSVELDAIRAIRKEMVADAEEARRQIDATEKRILNARKAQEEYARYATRNASAATDPRRVDLGGSAPRAIPAGASSGAGRGVKETISEYDKLIKKLSDELPRAAAEAEAAQMGYNKAQTEFLALAGSPAWASFSNSQRAVVASMFEGKIASEEAGEAAKALSKAYAEAAAERIKTIQSMERAADSLQSQNDALREEIELIGLSTEQQTLVLQQRNDVIILTKEATLAELERQSAITGTQTRVEIALASEIDALKERNALLGAKGVKNASVDAAKTAKDEWQKTTDSINQSLTDALMRGFESGKDFAKNLRDTVVNMFKTMVLRPVVSAALSPISGAINGAVSGAASSAGSSMLTSMGGSVLGNALGGVSALGIGASYGATSLFANGLGATLSAGGQMIGAGSVMSGIGTIAGALGPIALGISAIASIVSSLDDSGTYHTGGAAQYSGARGLRTSLGFRDNEEGLPSYNPNDNIDNQFGTGFGHVERGDQTISAVSAIAQGLGTALDGIAVAFGQTAGYEIATAFADDTSKDGAWGALRISKDGKELLNWENTRQSRWAPREFANGEEGYKEYLAEIAKDTRTVLLDMDLPSWADTMLESIGDAPSMDQLAATVQQIGVIQTSFVNLGKTIDGFAGMTDKAFEALMKAAGGIDALSANAGTYYANFYSDAERAAKTTAMLTEEVAKYGVKLPKTKEEYRKLVEEQLAAGEEGAKFAAVLLALSGVFAETANAAEAAAASIAGKRFDLENRLLVLQGKDREALDRRRGKEYDALWRESPELARMAAQIWALEDAANFTAAAYSALEKAIASEREAIEVQRSLAAESVDTLTGIFETIRSNVRELYSEVGSAAAMQVSQANAFIDNALRTAQTTGYMPDGAALSEAIGTARSGLSSGAYTSQFEADRDRLVLAGKLSTLGEITGEQLTTAERQLKYSQEQIEQLDKTLDYWREQIDIANGVYDATLSVADAIAALTAALGKPTTPTPPPPGGGGGGGGGGAVFGPGGSGTPQPTSPYNRPVYLGTAGTGYSPVTDAGEVDKLNHLASVYHAYDGTGDLTGLLTAIRDAGGTISDLEALSGYYQSDWRRAAESVGIPAFAVGTNYVPRDMLAQIHEGEAIVPKAYNPAANPGMGGGNSEVVSELRALREENRQQAGEIARLNLRMARVLEKFDGDGMPATRDEAVV